MRQALSACAVNSCWAPLARPLRLCFARGFATVAPDLYALVSVILPDTVLMIQKTAAALCERRVKTQTSEHQSQRELYLPRRVGILQFAEIRVVDVGVRVREFGMVQKIEKISPEFHL
jgi:hypothetical protein